MTVLLWWTGGSKPSFKPHVYTPSPFRCCRYDIRNRLEDKGQFGLKPILPRRRTEEEEELEEQLDHERFLALGVDILERELLEGNAVFTVLGEWNSWCVASTEETKKRSKEHSGSYQAVGFAYKESVPARPAVSPRVPPRPEHPPSSTVDVAENETERFVLPDGLVVPAHIRQVYNIIIDLRMLYIEPVKSRHHWAMKRCPD